MKLLVLAPAALSVGVLLSGQPPSDSTRNPLATNPTAVADGRRVYNQTCQSCHGAGGQGDRGPALTTTAPGRTATTMRTSFIRFVPASLAHRCRRSRA